MSSSTNRKPFFIVIILLLLLINGALWFFNHLERQKVVEQSEEIEDLSNDIAEKKKALFIQRDSLVLYMNQVDSGDSLRTQMEAELEKLDTYIKTLEKKNNFNKRKLADAENQINYFTGLVDNFKLQIGQLKVANERMAEQIKVEQEEKTQLKAEITQKTIDNETLVSEKEEVIAEVNKLSEEQDAMKERLQRASVLQLSRAIIKPYRINRRDKVIVTEKAKKTEQLEVCFEIVPNSEATLGNKDFTIIIKDPEGKVIPAAENGKGNFMTSDGERKRYTEVMTAGYNGKQGVFCGNWAEENYKVGNYSLEVYNQGYLVGTNKVRLE